jgi:hypothetical protein
LNVFQVTKQLEIELNNIKKLQEDLRHKDELLKAADDEKAYLREEKNQLETVSEVHLFLISVLFFPSSYQCSYYFF